MSNKLFIDLHESKSVDMSFGILCINKKTLKLSRGVESVNNLLLMLLFPVVG